MTGLLQVLALLALAFALVLIAGAVVYSVWRDGERGEP